MLSEPALKVYSILCNLDLCVNRIANKTVSLSQAGKIAESIAKIVVEESCFLFKIHIFIDYCITIPLN